MILSKNSCSIFSLFYPGHFGLLPHSYKMVAVAPSAMFSNSCIQVRKGLAVSLHNRKQKSSVKNSSTNCPFGIIGRKLDLVSLLS